MYTIIAFRKATWVSHILAILLIAKLSIVFYDGPNTMEKIW